MNRRVSGTLLTVIMLMLLSGCALSRSGATGLSQAQGTYFADLAKTLTQNRQALDSGLTLQLAADRSRQRTILDWQRDLQRAEVILEQRNPNVTGTQRLLELKLVEVDLAALDRITALEIIDIARKDAILKLYDKVIDAVNALEKNNKTILAYLEATDRKVLLRSLDVDSIFRLIANVQQLRGELANTTKEAQEEERKQTDDIRQAVGRARDLLIKVYGK